MDFDKKINFYEHANNINMRLDLEAKNASSEIVQKLLNLDKITLVKMLLASNEENKKLHDKLDSLREETREREAKAEARNEELMRANCRQMEYLVKLMDQLIDMQRQLNKTGDQYADLLVKFKQKEPQQAGPQVRIRKYNNGLTSRTYHHRLNCLNYLNWEGLMEYREDGEYSIDNNIAERNVRSFIVDRKNTMTIGSEEGCRDYAHMLPGQLSID